MKQLTINPFYGDMAEQAKSRLRLLLKMMPVHAYVVVRTEWTMLKVRVRSRRAAAAFAGQRGLMVNIGAGRLGKPGWVNVDAFPGPHVSCVYDCRKQLPFEDGSVRAIFCEHFFEHIDYTEEVPRFLSECRRVLEPGGRLRLIVPDAGRYIRAYAESGWDALAALRTLGADRSDPFLGGQYQTKMELINVLFRQGHEHKFAYDFETMAYVLDRYGFVGIQQQAFGVTAASGLGLAIDEPARAVESLYVEATTPAAPSA